MSETESFIRIQFIRLYTKYSKSNSISKKILSQALHKLDDELTYLTRSKKALTEEIITTRNNIYNNIKDIDTIDIDELEKIITK